MATSSHSEIISCEMQLQDPLCASSEGNKSRILTWIEGLEPNSPETHELEDNKRRRKQPVEFYDLVKDLSPSKRRTRSKRPLAAVCGNIMVPNPDQSQGFPERRRSPRRKQPPATPTRSTLDQSLDGTGEETPRPRMSSQNVGIVPLNDTLPMSMRFPAPTYDGSGSNAESDSLPSRKSSGAASTRISEEALTDRSTSPTKHLQDLENAQHPTCYETLNGRIARERGGVLNGYESLTGVCQCEAVIPHSVKVQDPVVP